MSWFNRNKAPKPQIGEFRIERVELVNGRTRYEVHEYVSVGGWGESWERWSKVGEERTFAQATSRVEELAGLKEQSRWVVWP